MHWPRRTRSVSSPGFLIQAQLTTAERQLALDHDIVALVSLRAAVFELDLLVRLGRLSAADAASLRQVLANVIATIRP